MDGPLGHIVNIKNVFGFPWPFKPTMGDSELCETVTFISKQLCDAAPNETHRGSE